ncbi:MAG: NAD+ synthase [Candidatus Caldarchaeum sp.]
MASIKTLAEELLKIDFSKTAASIESFIVETVESAGASGVVLGLSGGVDSSAVASLCARALSKERVTGLIMPAEFTPSQDVQDAKFLAQKLGIKTFLIPITSIVNSYAEQLGVKTSDLQAKMPFANLRARVRMTLLYFYANRHNLLVVGTGDRSEILLGYFTKYGDAGVDFLPVGGLYKTQLRWLSKDLGLPDSIAFKPSSPQLYPGHKAVDELPADYEVIDPILYALFDKKMSVDQVEALGVDRRLAEAVIERYKRSIHKRSLPNLGPMPTQ